MTKPRLIGFMSIVNGQIVPVATVAKTRPEIVKVAEARLAAPVAVVEPEPELVVEAEPVKTGNLGSGKAQHVLVEISDRKTGYAGYKHVRAACGADGLTYEGRIGQYEATCKRCAKALDPATPRMGKRELSAWLPDGSRATRTTAHDYKYVVAVRTHHAEGWGAWAWSSRLDLAEARVSEFTRRMDGKLETQIVNVTDA